MARTAVILVLGVGLLGLSPAAPVPESAGPSPLYFPTQVGTTWVYQHPNGELRLRITGVESKDKTSVVIVKMMTEEGRGRFWEKVEVSHEGLAVVENLMLSQSDPPIRWLKGPTKAGEKRRLNTTFRLGDADVPVEVSVICHGVEKVKVPAGEFRAIRVRGTVSWGSISLDSGKTEERWYAPDVGLVRWVSDSGHTVVLKSFTLGKD
jgi:hypothetical protein